MMCAKKWNVGKELASLLTIALGFMNVNVILGGRRLALIKMIISSFFLAWFPIVSSLFLLLPPALNRGTTYTPVQL
jgi:hypothetical protein